MERVLYRLKPSIKKLASVRELLPLLKGKYVFTESEEEHLCSTEYGPDEKVRCTQQHVYNHSADTVLVWLDG